MQCIRPSRSILQRTLSPCTIRTMSDSKPIPLSKAALSIPENVWVRSVQLVQQYKPVNLGQGFPDLPEVVPKRLKSCLIATQSDDAPVYYNQYSRGQGQVDLVRELALLYGLLYGRQIDPMKEIIISVGGYESLHCAINAVVNPGDEVILIEPYFDSYGETIRAIGATARCVPLRLKSGGTTSKDFILDKNELKAAFNDKTKCIVVNTPHNPTGKIFTREEIEFIADLCKEYNCLYLSDEVYEWLVYDDNEHFRAASLPGMWERTITVGSAGKTFNATGFKTGWAIGPEYLITACMGIHQGIVYTCPTPIQIALAKTIEQERVLMNTEHSYWRSLKTLMTTKRQQMYDMVTKAGFRAIIPDGGYFMILDLSDVDFQPPTNNKDLNYDQAFSEWLIKEKGIATIPVTSFFSPGHKKDFQRFLRLCFIKSEKTLKLAEEKLKEIDLSSS